MPRAHRRVGKASHRGIDHDSIGGARRRGAGRRGERATIGEFEAMMRGVAQQPTAERLDTALARARLPQGARGCWHVNAQAADAAQVRQRQLLAEFAAPAFAPTATAATGPATAAAA